MTTITTTTTPKSRPIQFRGVNVGRVMAGDKTQTRRVVSRLVGFGVRPVTGFGPSSTSGYDWTFRRSGGPGGGCWNDLRHDELLAACPYGVVGDQLWVREGLRLEDDGRLVYAHDGVAVDTRDAPDDYLCTRDHVPSIFMPRWATRLVLRITAVRVQRLQQIDARDAWAEGARCSCTKPIPCCAGNVIAFRDSWDRVNQHRKRCDWDSNRWVWALTFEVLATQGA